MSTKDTPTPRPEHRWPAGVAIIVVLVLYALLPSDLIFLNGYAVIALCLVLFVPAIIINPRRFTKQTGWSRAITLALVLVITIVNQITLLRLVIELVSSNHEGPALLLAALQVWVTNVIGFALLFWELDRGGPVARSTRVREDLRAADFRFPQDEDHDASTEVAARSAMRAGWQPTFVDYFYFSATNSMAFGPSDAMPLTHRAKLLMIWEAFAGFVILALVIARAVGLID